MKDYITVLKFDDLAPEDLLAELDQAIVEKRRAVVETPNLDILRVAYKNPPLRRKLNHADFSTIDGKPILWLAKLLKKKQFKHKISGSDLVPMLLAASNEKGYSVLIFGGKEGVGEKAKISIERDYPNLKVCGVICPEFGFEKDEKLTDRYIREINDCKADIVLLCVGCPKSEMFYFNHLDRFAPALYLNVGATVDFLAGTIKRAPKWMSKVGLEWLFRLFHDFRRLFKRYWLDFWFLQHMILMCLFRKKKIARLIAEDNKEEVEDENHCDRPDLP